MRASITLTALLLLPACSDDSAQRFDGRSRADAVTDARRLDAAPADRGSADQALKTGDAAAASGPCTATGKARESLCTQAAECQCPNTCLRWATGTAGSCWAACDAAKTDPKTGVNPACAGNAEACLSPGGGQAGCLPLGSLTGTFSLPVDTSAPASASGMGACNVTLKVVGITRTFQLGYGVAKSTGKFVFMLYPKTNLGDIDPSSYLGISFDPAADASAYTVGSHALAGAKGLTVMYTEVTSSGGTVTQMLLRAAAHDGTLTLTTAATGGKKLTTGELVSGTRAFRWDAEICGPSTEAC